MACINNKEVNKIKWKTQWIGNNTKMITYRYDWSQTAFLCHHAKARKEFQKFPRYYFMWQSQNQKNKISHLLLARMRRNFSFFNAYMRMFNGTFRDLNFEVNLATDDIELRSNSNTSIWAPGTSSIIDLLISLPADTFLTPMITRTPRSARTHAVSVPIPLVAPVK